MPGLDASDIASEYGSYYINQGQNLQRIATQLKLKTKTPMIATPVITSDTIWRGATGKMSSVIQAFQKNFTAKGDATFEAQKIPLFNIKVDWEDYPDEIVENWMGFLASISDNERANWPIIRYILEAYLIPQIQHDLESQCYYFGDHAAPTPGTAGITSAAMDGLRKQLTAGLSSGINDLSAIGTVNATNIFDKVEEITDKLTEVFRGVPLVLAMSTKNVVRYQRDRRNTHGTDTVHDPNKLTPDFYDSVKIVGLPSMDGTSDMFLTTQMNLKYIRRLGSEKPFKVESQKRLVSVMNDWWEGMGFHFNELVWYYRDPSSSSSSSL